MNRKLTVVSTENRGVFSRREALACGYTGSQIRDRLKAGVWIAVHRGQYAAAPAVDDLLPWEEAAVRHRLATRAAMRALPGSEVVVSHESALVLHGLPVWGMDLSEVHVTRTDSLHGRLRAGVRYHAGGLTDAEVMVVDGLVTTTVSRSVIDAACRVGYESAVAVADAALHRGLVTPAELQQAVDRARGWPGSGTALAAASFADGRSESVGESRLRVLMDNHGLPVPDLQTKFTSPSGIVVRVDFLFSDAGVIVEFDGMVKYRDSAPDVVVQEKQREDRLRAAGLIVVRVIWSELGKPELVVRRIRRALKQAGLARSAARSA